MSRRALVLMGGGGHAAVVAEAARAMGLEPVGCLDDDPGVHAALQRLDLPLLGAIDDLPHVLESMGPDVSIHAAVGDNDRRRAWLDRTGEFADVSCPSIVHPSAVVSPSAQLADGVFVAPRAVVNARAEIARGVVVNTGAIVEHDCVIGPCTHLAPHSTLSGDVRIGESCLIGSAAVVLPGLDIGHRVTIGAGSVVTGDLADGVTAVGIPARILSRSAS